MKIFQKLNKKSKTEQMFILLALFALAVGCMCVCGCGGGCSCETPSYSSKNYQGISASGCSIPGCGGCLSSEKGFDSACYPQSCKYVKASSDNYTEEYGKFDITGCDVRYYGDGCLGCNQIEKSCYFGCINWDYGTEQANGFFYGRSDSEEKIIGCAGENGGCVATDHSGQNLLYGMETLTGVE